MMASACTQHRVLNTEDTKGTEDTKETKCSAARLPPLAHQRVPEARPNPSERRGKASRSFPDRWRARLSAEPLRPTLCVLCSLLFPLCLLCLIGVQTATGLDPGFTTGSPWAQSGHMSGSYVGKSIASSVTNGTPSSVARAWRTWPEPVEGLRSTIEAAPTTCPPAAFAISMVSRVDPPVVST